MNSRWNNKKCYYINIFNHVCNLLWKTFTNVCFLNASCHVWELWLTFLFFLDRRFLPIYSKYWLLCAETRINSGDIWSILLSLRKTNEHLVQLGSAISAGPILCCIKLPPNLPQNYLQVIERTATKETCMMSGRIFLHIIILAGND